MRGRLSSLQSHLSVQVAEGHKLLQLRSDLTSRVARELLPFSSQLRSWILELVLELRVHPDEAFFPEGLSLRPGFAPSRRPQREPYQQDIVWSPDIHFTFAAPDPILGKVCEMLNAAPYVG